MKKRLLSTLSFLAIIFATTFTTTAQTGNTLAYQRATDDYLNATNARATMISTLIATYKSMNLPVTDIDGLSNAIVDAIWPEYTKEVALILKEYFSFDELNEITAFYKSPVGKKFAYYSPEIAQKSNQMVTNKFTGEIQRVVTEFMMK